MKPDERKMSNGWKEDKSLHMVSSRVFERQHAENIHVFFVLFSFAGSDWENKHWKQKSGIYLLFGGWTRLKYPPTPPLFSTSDFKGGTSLSLCASVLWNRRVTAVPPRSLLLFHIRLMRFGLSAHILSLCSLGEDSIYVYTLQSYLCCIFT